MFATSRLLMSGIFRRTFPDLPCRSKLRLTVPGLRGPLKPPHSTRCSFVGISALPKFGPNLFERDWGKSAYRVWGQALTLIDVLPVPATRELFDDPRRLPAMPVEGLVKLRSCTVVSETFPGADVAGQFTTEVIVKGPLRQASKEFPRQRANRSPPANRPMARCTSSGLGPNSDGSVGATVAVKLSTAAIWAISPRSVRPPVLACMTIDRR